LLTPPPSHHPSDTPHIFRPNPGSSIRRQEIKVFWFFSSEKNKFLLLSSEKEAKRLLFLSLVYRDPGLGRRMVSINSLAEAAWGEQLQNQKSFASFRNRPGRC
jgi:hypothetical protein